MKTVSWLEYTPVLARGPKSRAYRAVEERALPRPMNLLARSAFFWSFATNGPSPLSFTPATFDWDFGLWAATSGAAVPRALEIRPSNFELSPFHVGYRLAQSKVDPGLSQSRSLSRAAVSSGVRSAPVLAASRSRAVRSANVSLAPLMNASAASSLLIDEKSSLVTIWITRSAIFAWRVELGSASPRMNADACSYVCRLLSDPAMARAKRSCAPEGASISFCAVRFCSSVILALYFGSMLPEVRSFSTFDADSTYANG